MRGEAVEEKWSVEEVEEAATAAESGVEAAWEGGGRGWAGRRRWLGGRTETEWLWLSRLAVVLKLLTSVGIQNLPAGGPLTDLPIYRWRVRPRRRPSLSALSCLENRPLGL